MEMNRLSLLHHQHQTLQLGFRAFLHISYSSRFAVRPSSCNRSLRIGSLLPLTVNAMGSKRALSSSSKPAESPVLRDDDNNKNKKLKATTQNSQGVSAVKFMQVNHQKLQSLEIQSLKDDPSKIEAMTVQELRATLRNAGVPAKGRKNDLVSALKCFVDQQLDDENSEDCSENILLVESATIPDASELKRRKGRVKQPLTNKKTEKVNSEAVMTKVKLSVTSGKVSVGESSQARRKTSSDIQTTVVTPPMAEPWTVLAHKKPQKGWIAYNPTTMRRSPLGSNTKSVKLMSWNVNGLRAMLKVQGFSGLELVQRENFDVLCLQETKLQEKDVESIRECLIDGYENSFWTCSQSKLGYSGTAIISRIKPLSVSYGLGIPDHDIEGRVVTAEFDSFYLLSVYVPNSGDGLKRLSYRIAQWDPSLSDYMKELEKSKPVILTGDLNCAHQEIDIHNPAGNRRSAGFTDEERQSFGENFLSKGFVDTFRNQHPNAVGYTYWGYRHGARKTNKGWRLDYFLVSEAIASSVHDSYIVPDVTGSDHCPIGLVLKL